MVFHFVRLSWMCGVATAQDLFVRESRFLAQVEVDVRIEIFDPRPALGPTPSPSPGPAINVYPPHCGNNPDGWPVFNSPSDLQNDAWGDYFQHVYGEIPQSGYPICISSFQYLVDYAVSSAGIGRSPSESCPSNAGDYYKEMAYLQSPGSSWIWNPNAFSAIPGNVWVEIIHTAFKDDKGSSWMYYAAGSAIWYWTGNTTSYADHEDAVQDMLQKKCGNFECSEHFVELFSLAASMGYDSMQFLAHYDMKCGKSMEFDSAAELSRHDVNASEGSTWNYKCGAIEIVDVHGNGKTNCASSYRAGWEASRDCDCQQADYANCAGFGDQSR